jgi:hypothetical protein
MIFTDSNYFIHIVKSVCHYLACILTDFKAYFANAQALDKSTNSKKNGMASL